MDDQECLKLIDTAPSDWLINAIAAREHVHPQTVKDRVHRREKRVRVRKKKHTG